MYAKVILSYSIITAWGYLLRKVMERKKKRNLSKIGYIKKMNFNLKFPAFLVLANVESHQHNNDEVQKE